MQKIPKVTLLELRPFTTNAFPQTTSSRSVYPQQFVQVFGDDLQIIQTPTQHFSRSVKSKVVQRIHCLQCILTPFYNVDTIRKL
ncbi:hypothetical protein TNCV_4792491 [Trichonephila clavipes]|nr:hypothetical protein TNCV_4792491 [Trichonephila clavipes]